MRLYKVSEWQIGSYWYTGDQSDLAHNSNLWYIPPRLLGIPLTDWIIKLKEEFNATILGFNPDSNNGKSLLSVGWKNYNDCHRYTLWINKQARENHWTFP